MKTWMLTGWPMGFFLIIVLIRRFITPPQSLTRKFLRFFTRPSIIGGNDYINDGKGGGRLLVEVVG